MNVLLVDNSNGRTKFALAENGVLSSEVRMLPTNALAENAVRDLLAGWAFEKTALCSVVPAAAGLLTRYLLPLGPVQQIHADLPGLPVDFSGYAGRETLGADRVANAVGAVVQCRQVPLLVMDAGTATTLDVVLPASEGALPRFAGGVIAPGMGTMSAALHSRTALLPQVPLQLPSQAVGTTTPEALQNGCVRGYRGLINELIAAMEEECACRFLLLATGGDAALISELLQREVHVDPCLTLNGIARCSA